MKKMKKALASLLAATMVMSMSVTAWADNEVVPDKEETKTETSYVEDDNPKFSKIYKITNDNTENPEETFTFTFTNGTVVKNYSDVKITAPNIANTTVKFDKGKATKDGVKKAVEVALKNITWPGVGVYTYDVKETAGTTAGVTYDSKVAKLKVTVAFRESTETYYAAFVTLNLADKDNDGNTDTKVAGFENEYSAGSLAVSKTVAGNMGNQKDKYFTVKVTFHAPENKTVMSDIFYNASTETSKYTGTSVVVISADENPAIDGVQGWTGDKEVEILLKHNDTITFTNIPYGVTYDVEENDYTNEGYKPAEYTLNGAVTATTTAVSGEKLDEGNETVAILNTKEGQVDTGILLDSAPYVLLLALAGVGAFAVATKKREEEF